MQMRSEPKKIKRTRISIVKLGEGGGVNAGVPSNAATSTE